MSKALKDAIRQVAPVVLDAEQVVILKANGKRETYEPEKLRESLLRSGASHKAAEETLAHVQTKLYSNITTDEIYRIAFDALKKIEGPTARKYSLRRAIMELGPSGFPFEKFVAEIFKAKGYQTLTGETVLGGCVAHEIDVVAWNEKKLIMVEAKFHNELGTKSDLKVALYVRARFDDLEGNVYNYGKVDRHITDGWLITNTKFSSTAIHYGECKNLTMIGWNYPAEGNLQDMIEEEGLHPVTCLISLTPEQKRVLINSQVVLCSHILERPSVLKELFSDKFDADAVINEINEL
jgi:hypothetical protein